jgi:hypothetical protein
MPDPALGRVEPPRHRAPSIPGDPKATPLPTEITGVWRLSSGIVALVALGWAAYLAYENYTGVATAAFLAVAILFGVICFAGVVPVSLKVGDMQVQFEDKQREAIQKLAQGLQTTRSKIRAANGNVTEQADAIASTADALRRNLPAAQGLSMQDIMGLVAPPEADVPQAALDKAAENLGSGAGPA